jgi:hypothetical protein
MTCRIVYICRGFEGEGPYWMTDPIEEATRPFQGDRIMFCAADVARSQASIVVPPWRWPPSTNLDYEVKIEVPEPESGDKEAYEEWLRARGFRLVPSYEYAALFGMPDLAARFPPPW